jgi:hypothetical protein
MAEASLWDETITITRGELGTMLDALQMDQSELQAMENGTKYRRPQWLRELGYKALRVALEKRDG